MIVTAKIMKKGYYIANEVNGVWFNGDDTLDDITTELLSVKDFYESLSTASSNIACFVEDEDDIAMMRLIEDEYGIR